MSKSTSISMEHVTKLVEICSEIQIGFQVTEKDINITAFDKGFMANIFLVEFLISTPTDIPSKIVIKFYPEVCGGFHRVNAQLNNLFAGQAGLSPRVLLVRTDSLVMEYINAGELTQQDDHDPVIRKTIAKMLAQFHSIQVPIVRNHHKEKISRVFDEIYSEELNAKITFGNVKSAFEKLNLENILSGNLRAEANYVRDLLLAHEQHFPLVFAHRDFNHNNILVEQSSKSIYFIDFDLSWYYYRGADIGRYLLDCKQPEQFTDNELITDAEMAEFINWYNEENSRNYGTTYLKASENAPDKMLIEAKVFVLYSYFVDIIFCMWRASDLNEADLDKRDQFLIHGDKRFVGYLKTKKRFQADGTIH